MRNILKSHSEVCHFWANQIQPSGKAGNVYFENDRIYSYGSHFCMARILPSGTVAFTTRDYSVSTTQHKSMARSAAKHRTIVYCHNPDNFARTNMEFARRAIAAALTASEKPRIRQTTRDGHKAHALYLAQQANEYLAALPDDEKQSVLPIDTTDLESIRTHLDNVARIEREQQEAERQTQLINLTQQLQWWREGAVNRLSNLYYLPVALRLSSDRETIQTSHGADIPIADAIRLWPFIQRVRNILHEDWAVDAATPNARMGVYKLSLIRADGSIVVGCHDIAYTELESIAIKLGLTVNILSAASV